MTKLAIAKVEVLPPTERKRRGRPEKPFDHDKLDALQVAAPESSTELFAQLFIFDARMLDKETQQELLRIMPQLVHARRAWKAHFLEHGCVLCHAGRKVDPTRHIAANLRSAGMSWEKIFEALTVDTELTTRDRKLIRTAVSNILKRRARGVKGRKPGISSLPTLYGSGGFCDACQGVIRQRMLKRFREVTEGRDLAGELASIRRRFDAAQQLFNGDDE